MFTIKTVTGGRFPDTEYDESLTVAVISLDEAIEYAVEQGVTQDIFQRQTRRARVHVDGGVDYFSFSHPEGGTDGFIAPRKVA